MQIRGLYKESEFRRLLRYTRSCRSIYSNIIHFDSNRRAEAE